jgi:FKBP-type peptidyl-prolyl cis-trans isomerase FkpA
MLEAGRLAGFLFSPLSLVLWHMHRPLLLLILAGTATAAAGCDLNDFRRTPIERAGFASELNVDTTAMTATPSGLRYLDLKLGDGAAASAGSSVAVQYTGWLTDGRMFDTSRGRGPLEFRIGNHEVISGWDEGLTGMKVGGKRKLVIPPSLGYGAEGSPPVIPANATLVFEVELVGLR